MSDISEKFVTGKGSFVADLTLPDMLHLKIVRSIYARAKLLTVQGGITGADLKATMTSVGEGEAEGKGVIPYPALARDRVNYVGQPIAGVVGRTEAEAEDLLASVHVEYEPLKPIVDAEAAVAAEPIHPGSKSNVLDSSRAGKPFGDPHVPIVLEETLRNERIVPNPLEPRGMLAQWGGSRLTVYAATQSANSWQEGFAESLHLPKSAVRVIHMDTGGAFGSKGGIYPEYVVAAHIAMREKRPVRWIETRTEHLQAAEQGRGIRAKMKLYADRTGRVHGVRGDILVDGGAYSAGMGEFMARWVGYQVTGPYAIPNVFIEGKTMYTNKVPLGPYRGAGRPEAAFFMERMMDFLSDELRMDPAQVRLRNTRATAWKGPTGLHVPPARRFLQDAVRQLGYRKLGRENGAGFSCFLLIPAASSGEGARIRAEGGRVHVWLGGDAQGQGHETFVRTLASKELGILESRIDLEHGDTDALPKGVGSWGSRSAIVAGGAVIEAARKVKAQVRKRHGRYSSERLLAGTFDAKTFFEPKGNFNSLGANLVTADLEETGFVRVREVRAYYDVGEVLNRAMVESQIEGGSTQAMGQVLFEGAFYDPQGNVLATSLADAGLPTALESPHFVVKTAKTKSTAPHGAKGVGEAPTIGVPPALIRAIERQAGKRLTRTPVRPEDVAQAT